MHVSYSSFNATISIDVILYVRYKYCTISYENVKLRVVQFTLRIISSIVAYVK